MVPMAVLVLIALTPAYETFTSTTLLARVGLQVLSACIWVIGTVCGMVLFLGMLAYLLVLDTSSWKLVWLIIFLFTACFGSSIYFFLVYRKQVFRPLYGRLE
jgi:hypothetical protein